MIQTHYPLTSSAEAVLTVAEFLTDLAAPEKNHCQDILAVNYDRYTNKAILTPASKELLLITWVHGQWFAGCAPIRGASTGYKRNTPDVQATWGPLETATPASPVRWDDCELVACAVCIQRIHRRDHLSGNGKGANAVR
jgi:hypothetical protein